MFNPVPDSAILQHLLYSDIIYPSQRMLNRDKCGLPTSLLVTGGLATARIIDVALRHGISLCVLPILRSSTSTFASSIWVLKHSENVFFAGGQLACVVVNNVGSEEWRSIAPRYAKLLKTYQDQGQLGVITCTEIAQAV
jgi:hypothetical protein